ncbi:MAG: amidohydrolase family protein [Candidatus Pseudobacter hemicellulosilyticus]|uniref:Amidohydrolase family protein n=1 Tax=Candidatus Pseudobacter hemicellulosilyticus TaxID=3121375 RepID=A0AAJ5WZJ6_9BACT|nr:MAG: amidohydrolase family protein [Pseudobacter sp.]
MRYRKFTADNIFDGYQWRGSGQALILDATGQVLDLVPVSAAGDDIRSLPGTLCPGFVNTHCHLELSHLKGRIPPGTGMVDFLLSVMRQRSFPPEEIAGAIELAESGMIRSGIVAVGDICNTTDTLARKQGRGIFYHHFIETIGFVAAAAEQRFEQSKAVYDRFVAAFGAATCSMVPHAPYSVSPALLALINALPGNRLLSIHNQESKAETEFLLQGAGDFLRLYKALGVDLSGYKGAGRRSPEAYLPVLTNATALILVHDVETAAADLAYLQGGLNKTAATAAAPAMPGTTVMAGPVDTATANAASGPAIYFALCPNANLYIGNDLPDIPLLLAHNACISIGTDSLASNTQLNILEELKTIHRAYPQLAISTLLQWATLNGAQALQQTARFGSFEQGKKPGVVWLRGVGPDRLALDASSSIL